MPVILFQWLTAHLFADFALQNKKLVQQKKLYKQKSWFLYVHCLIHAALIYVLSPDKSLWLIPAIVFVSHYCIDLWKVYQKQDNAFAFIIDQVLHIIVLFILWMVFYEPNNWIISITQKWLADYNFWVIASGYLIIAFPLSYLLGFATQRWRNEVEKVFSRSETSLSEAGKWIGIFERILVFTFVINNHFEGIGFLIAAKSILRFNDIKGSEMRKEAEYVLIGTLMSFASSIVMGLIVVKIVS